VRGEVAEHPGHGVLYSDINFFLVGEIVQRVSHQPLEVFVAREVYEPLKMVDTATCRRKQSWGGSHPPRWSTAYLPWGGARSDCPATWGGVAAAGLFTTAPDLARYARMLLNQGSLDGVRIFKPETVELMTSVQTPATLLTVRRGLGWDIDSGYSVRAESSFRWVPMATRAGRAPRCGSIRSRRRS